MDDLCADVAVYFVSSGTQRLITLSRLPPPPPHAQPRTCDAAHGWHRTAPGIKKTTAQTAARSRYVRVSRK